MVFYSVQNDKILDWSKLKAFADNKMNEAHMMILVFDRVEKIVGKGQNDGYQEFLLFPQNFQKAYFSRSSKVGIMWERVNPLPYNPDFERF